MSTLSENVTLTITVDSLGLARAGFGIMLIVSHSATWVERTRTYEDEAGVTADFAEGTPENIAASAAFAQSPHPEQVMIGRASNKPTQQYTIAATPFNSTLYGINVVAPNATPTNPVSYTSDANATIQEIHNGLVTALNAVPSKNYTATFGLLATNLAGIVVTATASTDQLNHTAHGWNTGDGPIQFTNSGGGLPAGIAALTDYWVVKVDADNFKIATSLTNALAGTIVDITTNGTGTQTATPDNGSLSPILPFLVTGSASANWFSLEVLNYSLLSNKQSHVDPGIATDLDAILNESDAWYALDTNFNSKAYVLAAAAWVESHGKLYVVDVVDTDAINTVVGGATDTLASLNALTYNRTAGAFYPAPATAFSAAWMGRVLPDVPGSATWNDKTLSGVVATNLTPTQRTNLKARNANYYVSVGGVNKTQGQGKVAGGSFSFIDVTTGLDALTDDMTKRVFEAVAGPEKLPYDEFGIAVVRSEVKSALKAANDNGVIDDDFDVQVPKLAAVSGADKAARILRNVKWSATLTGSIDIVNITGVVTF